MDRMRGITVPCFLINLFINILRLYNFPAFMVSVVDLCELRERHILFTLIKIYANDIYTHGNKISITYVFTSVSFKLQFV